MDTCAFAYMESEWKISRPSPDVPYANELQVQKIRLGIFVLVAAVRAWKLSALVMEKAADW